MIDEPVIDEFENALIDELKKLGYDGHTRKDELPGNSGLALGALGGFAQAIGPHLADNPAALRVFAAFLRGYARVADQAAVELEKRSDARAAGA